MLGKFIAEDPLGFASGDTNLYAFAWSNPRNWNDPSGLSAAVEEGETASVAVAAAEAEALLGQRIACELVRTALALAIDGDILPAKYEVERQRNPVPSISRRIT